MCTGVLVTGVYISDAIITFTLSELESEIFKCALSLAMNGLL